MKLSEAIRLGSMLKPQGFGIDSMASKAYSCALGAALDATAGENRSFQYSEVYRRWPWTIEDLDCPFYCKRDGDGSRAAGSVIYHLNDSHRWTREQIADWVESVEREQEAKTAPQPVDIPVER